MIPTITLSRVPCVALAMAGLALSACGEQTADTPPETDVPSSDASKTTQDSMAPLADQLHARYENYLASADEHKKQVYREGIEAVAASGVLDRATKTGDRAPAFTLPDHNEQAVTLESLLAEGPVVLVWYRGGWCPYCNLTLRAYHDAMPRINAAGATLVAVSPELPDQTRETVNKNGLDYVVLSDVNNTVAKEYGVVFSLTPEVHEIYNKAFGLDTHNGDPSGELPLAATYVIDTEGVVRYAFLDPDYTKRAEPADVLSALEALD